jgi:hypothetical protein
MMPFRPAAHVFARARQICPMAARMQLLGKRLLTLAQILTLARAGKFVRINRPSPLVNLRVCW